MSKIELLRHLLTMAAADGGVSEGELKMLGQRAVSWGVSDEQFGELLGEASRGDLPLVIPESIDDRETLIKDLVRMMAADGQLHDDEKKLFAVVASQMDVDSAELNLMIDQALREG